ncbi:glycosyltransferase family 2 protein [Phaeobacter marinintestinus]|uniref:glycosyltransferase family 2 protein n=1 Tax=Falsiphaeobacter marinintestinus TaxID=1492905 RepID=UPI0011B68F15|nr:glycosyltransferase family 2 protein [Phaeobacter marinintestinus]
MSDPSILTIILNYQTPDMTLKSAEAAMREMAGLRGEIVIVDNGSGDGSFERLTDQAKARGWTGSGRLRVVASCRNGGFGAGMNFGMQAGLSDGSRADFVYLLNSDAWPEPDAIRILRDFLIDHPKAGMAGSYVKGEDGEPHRTAFRFPSAAGEFEMSARTGVFSRLFAKSIVPIPIPKVDTRIDWTAGASLMLRSDMLDQIGGFDETFFLYYEETDLCRRAAQAGWETWYIPSSEVVHVGSASTGMKEWGRTPPYWLDSRLYYFSKNHGAIYAGLATVSRLSGTLIYDLRRLVQGKPQADADYFLRDLTAHACRNLFRRPDIATQATSMKTAPVTEDRK